MYARERKWKSFTNMIIDNSIQDFTFVMTDTKFKEKISF